MNWIRDNLEWNQIDKSIIWNLILEFEWNSIWIWGYVLIGDQLEWITLVYVEVVADERDRVKCPTQRYKFISYMSLDFMSRIGNPLGYFDFFWIGGGLERRVVVWRIDQYKGDAGKKIRKVKVLENFQDFWKFSLIRIG